MYITNGKVIVHHNINNHRIRSTFFILFAMRLLDKKKSVRYRKQKINNLKREIELQIPFVGK